MAFLLFIFLSIIFILSLMQIYKNIVLSISLTQVYYIMYGCIIIKIMIII